MPELPEVETIKRGLKSRVTGRTVSGIRYGDRKPLQVDPAVLEQALRGKTFEGLDRRGKFLIAQLDDSLLVFHLGMTGQLTFRNPALPDSGRFRRHPTTGLQRARQHAPDKHTHLQIIFADGTALLYRDIRKFGKIHLIPREEAAQRTFFGHLGMEPLSKDYRVERFLRYMGRRKTQVKALLLDQRFIAGIGNIYADEALFEAGVHPANRVRYLRKYEKLRLFEVIPRVLERGILARGTSLRDYVDGEGEPGTHQEELLVYGRGGAPCRRCGGIIRKVVVAQRGTHFCPSCQIRR
jgi:formamidopyrimidine-DNA glycosylase